MDAYFCRFNNFTPDPNSSLIDNFDRLEAEQYWPPYSRIRTRERRRFRDAMIDEFNTKYGTDANNLQSWQNLCRVVGAYPIPETITQCRKTVRSRHVNLVDLIDTSASSNNRPVRVFGSLEELKEYTRETGKYFPKNPAKAGGILKSLLREMSTRHVMQRGLR